MKVIHSYGSRLFVQVTAGNGRNLFINNTWDDNDDIGSDEDAKVDVDKVCKVPRDADLVNAMNAPTDGTPNFWDPSRKHRGLTKKEIHDYVVAFGKTAKMLQDGDVDGIEIHAFHEGYLLDEFSIANTNMRTDEYGGSLENRARFMCEIIREVKRVCGEDFPVSVRYSVASKMKAYNQGALPGEPYVEFGRSLEESPALARILQDAGCDLLNCDNGSYEGWYWAHPPMYMPKNCNMLDAVYLKQFVDIPVSVSGRMQEVDVSANAIADHKIDAITIGRQLLADPDWPTKVKEGRLDDIRPCILQVEGLCGANSMMLRDLFKLHNVKVYTSAKLTKITETGISITMPNSSEGIPVDTVIMAVGFNPDPSLAEAIKAKKDTHIIGDAIDVGNLLSVVWGAYDIAMAL